MKSLAEGRMKRMEEELQELRGKVNDQSAKMAPVREGERRDRVVGYL